MNDEIALGDIEEQLPNEEVLAEESTGTHEVDLCEEDGSGRSAKIYSLAALVMIIAGDYLLFRGGGGYAYGVMTLLTAGLVALCNWKGFRGGILFAFGCLLLLVAHSAWQFDPLVPVVSTLLCFFLSYTMVFDKLKTLPALQDLFYSINRIFHSFAAIIKVAFSCKKRKKVQGKKINLLAYIVPLVVCIVFVAIFAKANTVVMEFLDNIIPYITDVLKNLPDYLPSPVEALFWMLMLLVAAFVLLPCRFVFRATKKSNSRFSRWIARSETAEVAPEERDADAYGWGQIWRNTLVAVNLLFAAYIFLEIKYLFAGEVLPAGVSYSEYAHRGVFWLTVALALASLLLSLSCGAKQYTSRYYPQIRILGYVWIALCFLMGFLTYQRLYIYFCFNGLTEMRILGAVGITLVLAGLVLVGLMIRRQRSMYWLLNKQMMAMLLAVFIFYLMPRDYLCTAVNVHLAENATSVGELSPLVIVAYHPVAPESARTLVRLLSYNNKNIPQVDAQQIRRGVAGLLWILYEDKWVRTGEDWRGNDYSVEQAKKLVEEHLPQIREIVGESGKVKALDDFKKYTRRWY